MRPERKTYGYCPRSIHQELDITNKAIGKIGVCVGLLIAGGYFLYKKVDNLSKEVKKMKEETGK